MREIVHIQAGQCGNQIGAKVCIYDVHFLVVQPSFMDVDSFPLSIGSVRLFIHFAGNIFNKMHLR